MSAPTEPRQVLLSAHRGGCGRSPEIENTWAAFEAAVQTAVEYVEFDIQRTVDGEYLLAHDDRVKINGTVRHLSTMTADEVDRALGVRVRYRDVLALLAATGRKAHLDFKFTSPDHLYPDSASTYEVEAVLIAREFLADTDFIVTSAEDRSIRAVADWMETCRVLRCWWGSPSGDTG